MKECNTSDRLKEFMKEKGLKQTDIIENGTYTSKLELVKNVAAIGNATVKYNNVNNVTLEDYKSGQTILEQQMDAFNNPNKIY